MADINLLQTQTQATSTTFFLARILNYLGTILLIFIVAITVYFYYSTSSNNKKTDQDKALIVNLETKIRANDQYPLLVDNQNKLKDLGTLLSIHKDWSAFLPTLFDATYKDVTFTRLTANTQGSVLIDGAVPSFASLDKLMLGLTQNDVQNTIRDVRLISVGVGSTSDHPAKTFTIQITFNTNLIKANYGKQAQAEAQ